MRILPVLRHLLLLVACGFLPWCWAQTEVNLGDDLFPAEEKEPTEKAAEEQEEPQRQLTMELMGQINQEVKDEMDQILAKLIDEERLARQWGIDWPVPEVEAEVRAIEELARRRVAELAAEKYPPTLKEQYQEEADKKYGEYQAGDHVVLRRTHNRPPIAGIFRERDGMGVKIDNQVYALTDVVPEDQARFLPGLAERMKDKYVQEKVNELLAKRQEFIKANFETVRNELYRQHKYLLIYDEPIPQAEYMRRKLVQHRGNLIKEVMPLVEAKIYYKYGFEQFQGQWLPIRAVEQIREETLFDPTEPMRELDLLLEDSYERTSVADATRSPFDEE